MKYEALRKQGWLFAVIVTTVVFSAVYLDLASKFWFEDDPWQYAFINDLGGAWDIFLSPKVMRSFGTGASAVPMQMLSTWIDLKLFGISASAAYVHNMVSLVATTILLYSAQGSACWGNRSSGPRRGTIWEEPLPPVPRCCSASASTIPNAEQNCSGTPPC